METLSLLPPTCPLVSTNNGNTADAPTAPRTNNKPTSPTSNNTNTNDSPEKKHGPEDDSDSDSPESPDAIKTKKRALSPSAALSNGPNGFTSVPLEGTRLRSPSSTSTSSSDTHAHIDPQDLTLLKVIGRGTFAQQVALARLGGLGAPQRLVVVKSLDKQRLIARQQVAHTLTEKRVLETLGGAHPFIVQLVAAFQTATDLHFVLEYCQGGELFFHLQQQQQQKFSECATQFYAAEVLSALHALHANGIVYRDLKPENVLLDAQGHVKLADFGFAKQDMVDGKRTFSFCGSPEYLSPEMVHKRGHGVETDMWSFGCFVYELLTGAPPFQHTNLRRLFTLIEEGRVWYPPFLSGAAVALLQGLLRVNPTSRLTATEAMDHAFFKGLDWDELLQRHVAPPLVPTCASGECTQNFDDGFTSEPVQSLLGTKNGPGITSKDWSKRPRQDSADVFCGF